MLTKLSFIHPPSVSFSVRARNLNSHYAFVCSKEYSFNWLCCFCACLQPFKFIYSCCLNDHTLLGAQEYSFYWEHIVIKPNDQREDQQQPTWQDILSNFCSGSCFEFKCVFTPTPQQFTGTIFLWFIFHRTMSMKWGSTHQLNQAVSWLQHSTRTSTMYGQTYLNVDR